MDDPNEQYAEREEFEKQYYGLVASSRQLISAARKLLQSEAVSEVGSCGAHTHKHNSIRLPKIDLPKFNGAYHDWLEFRDTFISIIHINNNIDNINKLHYLRASLKGSAALVINNLDFTSTNYDIAWKLLCDRYDNNRLLVNNHVQMLFNVEPINKEASKALRYIIDITNKNLRALSTLGQPVQHWDTLIIHLMTSKLDQVTNRQWEEYRNSLCDSPTFSTFITFLNNRADLLETIEQTKLVKLQSDLSKNSNIKTKSLIVSENKLKPISCPMCKQSHFLFLCPEFRELSVQTRLEKVQQFGVCSNCLRVGHNSKICRLGPCTYCTVKHNTLLHVHNEPNSNSTTIALSAEHSTENSKLLSNCNNTTSLAFSAKHTTDKVKAPNTAVVKIASYYGGISILDIYSCFIQFKLTKTESIYSKSITS